MTCWLTSITAEQLRVKYTIATDQQRIAWRSRQKCMVRSEEIRSLHSVKRMRRLTRNTNVVASASISFIIPSWQRVGPFRVKLKCHVRLMQIPCTFYVIFLLLLYFFIIFLYFLVLRRLRLPEFARELNDIYTVKIFLQILLQPRFFSFSEYIQYAASSKWHN